MRVASKQTVPLGALTADTLGRLRALSPRLRWSITAVCGLLTLLVGISVVLLVRHRAEVEARRISALREEASRRNAFSNADRKAVTFENVNEALGLTGDIGTWVDVNNDGWVDLGPKWRNEGGKRFIPVEGAQSGGEAWADLDNDGYLDSFSSGGGVVCFGSQDGSFECTSMPEKPMGVSNSGTLLDINGDGLIDIYWGGYENWGIVNAYPDAIFINEGNRKFTLHWKQDNPIFPTRGLAAADYNNDGATDIYASNYRLCGNVLWRNNGSGKFIFASDECGVLGGHGHSIGSAWGDIDNDGLIDLFAGNFAHGGQPQSRFLRNPGPEHDFKFEDKGTCGIHYQESYASPTLGDYDNDGDLDLFFTTVYGHNHSVLYRNDGDWKFTNVTAEAGVGGLPATYQAAWGDFDNDGDLDLVSAGRLFCNSGTSNNWLKVKLVGSARAEQQGGRVNRAAIGAQVRIKMGKVILTRQVESSTGEKNMNEQTLHFGLGAHDGKVKMEISWPYTKRKQTATATANTVVTIDCTSE